MKVKNIYDCPDSCNKCGGKNKTIAKDSVADIVTEYKTKCVDCGFEDYWVTGFFQSGVDGYNKSEKY